MGPTPVARQILIDPCACVCVCVIVMHLKTTCPILILLFAKCSLRVGGGRRTIPVSKFLSVSIWRTKCSSPHKIACYKSITYGNYTISNYNQLFTLILGFVHTDDVIVLPYYKN